MAESESLMGTSPNGIPNSFTIVKPIMIPYLNMVYNVSQQTDIIKTDSLTYVFIYD